MSSKQQDNASVHWHILGAGSLGCMWAAYFAKSGFPCSLLLKNHQQLKAYQQRNKIGLRCASELSHYTIGAKTSEQIRKPISHLLVCTKAHQALTAVQNITKYLAPDSKVLLMQNGMGSQQAVRNLLNKQQVFCAVTTDGAWQEKPYQVVHAGKGETLIGSLSQRTDPQILLDQLPRQYLNIQPSHEIEMELLKKLAINCAINPLTAIHQCRNGELNKNSDLARQVSILCTEISQLLNICNQPQLGKDLEKNVRAVITTTADNRSSMLQDLQAGRSTEIDYITGYLLDLGQQHAMTFPENRKIFKQVKELTKRSN